MPTIWRTRTTVRPRRPYALSKAASGASVTGTIAANLPALQVAAAGWEAISGTIAANLPALQISASGSGSSLPNNSYSTTFPNTENPISEGSVWTLGGTDGVDWHDIRTTTNEAFGTQSGTDSSLFNDSLAVMKGTWGNDQYARATVFNTLTGAAGFTAEVELLLRFSVSSHDAHGYECNFSCNSSIAYTEIVRWNGAQGSFNVLSHVDGPHVVGGDVISAKIVGTVITVYINGSQVNTYDTTSDTTKWSSGKPGIGQWLDDSSGTRGATHHGLTDFAATAVPTGTIASNLPGLQVAASGFTRVTGTEAANLPALVIVASGTVLNPITGTVAANLPPLVFAASGTVLNPITGTIAANLPRLVIVAGGNLPSAPPAVGVSYFFIGPPIGVAYVDVPARGVAVHA